MSAGSIEFRGARLRYRREGTGDPVLVPGSAVYYSKAFSASLRAHLDLVFCDCRHFVGDYLPSEAELAALTLESFADDVEAVRQHLGLERVTVLGHSVHAQIALAYACKYPERVQRLVLLAAVPCRFDEFAADADAYFAEHASPERKAVLAAGTERLEERLAAAPPSRSFAVMYAARGALYWTNPRFDATHLLEGVENSAAFARLFAVVPSKADVRKAVEGVRVPTLLVLGKRDFGIPYTVWMPMVDGLAHVECVVLPEDGHSPQVESPERFDSLLVEWLRRH
jgi:proline iminopeptidase